MKLLYPIDPVTKAVFLRGSGHIGPAAYGGSRFNVYVSSETCDAGVTLDVAGNKTLDEIGGELCHLDLCVLSAVGGIAHDGELEFSVADIMRSLGYVNPSSSYMSSTCNRMLKSVAKMTSVVVAMDAVIGRGDKLWLAQVPKTPVIKAKPLGGRGATSSIRLLPSASDDPLSALPFLSRACNAKQVIPIDACQIPGFSGRRVSLAQRQAAIYIAVRALEKHPNYRVLLETMFRDIGVEFGNRQMKSRFLRELRSTLEQMASEGTVIDGYEITRAVDNAPKTIILGPTRNR